MFQRVWKSRGAVWEPFGGSKILGALKNTQGAQGIRVVRSDLDSDMSEIGALEIWVPQKYARRLRNTRFHPSLDATGGGRGVAKILTFQEYARRSRNTYVFNAFES